MKRLYNGISDFYRRGGGSLDHRTPRAKISLDEARQIVNDSGSVKDLFVSLRYGLVQLVKQDFMREVRSLKMRDARRSKVIAEHDTKRKILILYP